MTGTASAAAESPVLAVSEALVFESGPSSWRVPELEVPSAGWLALVPEDPRPGDDPSYELSRIVATIRRPSQGRLRLLDQDVYALDANARQALRRQLGFVHRSGGLLSNMNIRDNVAMPVSVHARLAAEREHAHVSGLLDELELAGVANHLPHQLNEHDRWCCCLARALSLDPAWLVVEGMSAGSPEARLSAPWRALLRRRADYGLSMWVCLPAADAEYEAAFCDSGGTVVRYRRLEGSS